MSVVQYRARIVATDGKSWTSPWFDTDTGEVPDVMIRYVTRLVAPPMRGRNIELHRRELLPERAD